MPTYAKTTTVTVDKSRAEIEHTLLRYGASSFMYGYDREMAAVGFVLNGRQIRFTLPLPPRDDDAFWYTEVKRRKRSHEQALALWEQACRQRWRALSLVIKAKLEAVEAGIATVEDEFLAYTALPNGDTVSDWLGPQIERVYQTGLMPSMLPMLSSGNDAEIVEGDVLAD